MDATQLTAQLQVLYSETHIPMLKDGEFTVSMFALANKCNSGTAGRLIQRAIEQNKIEPVGDRLHQRKRVQAYRFVTV